LEKRKFLENFNIENKNGNCATFLKISSLKKSKFRNFLENIKILSFLVKIEKY